MVYLEGKGKQKMSTRTNIIIQEDGDTKVILYHHCDGHIEGVGIDLIRYLVKLDKKKGIVKYKDLLAVLPEEYEETTGIHGDIEYLYTIRFTESGIQMWVDGYERKLYSYDYHTARYHTSSERLYIEEQELKEGTALGAYNKQADWVVLWDLFKQEQKRKNKRKKEQ